MHLSLRWAERCKRAFEVAPAGRALFGIVQGGDHRGLREDSARALAAIDFHGYAIGGLAVGEPQEVMLDIVAVTTAVLPADRPRYLMGVGTPADILGAIGRGIDMFDCVMPTRNGRHGVAFTRFGPINIKNAQHANDPRPLDPQSRCPAARDFSRAYLHHLFKAGETLGGTLLSVIILFYYQELVAGARAAIMAGRFDDFVAQTRGQWTAKAGPSEIMTPRRAAAPCAAGHGDDPHIKNPPIRTTPERRVLDIRGRNARLTGATTPSPAGRGSRRRGSRRCGY